MTHVAEPDKSTARIVENQKHSQTGSNNSDSLQNKPSAAATENGAFDLRDSNRSHRCLNTNPRQTLTNLGTSTARKDEKFAVPFGDKASSRVNSINRTILEFQEQLRDIARSVDSRSKRQKAAAAESSSSTESYRYANRNSQGSQQNGDLHKNLVDIESSSVEQAPALPPRRPRSLSPEAIYANIPARQKPRVSSPPNRI